MVNVIRITDGDPTSRDQSSCSQSATRMPDKDVVNVRVTGALRLSAAHFAAQSVFHVCDVGNRVQLAQSSERAVHNYIEIGHDGHE